VKQGHYYRSTAQRHQVISVSQLGVNSIILPNVSCKKNKT